MDIFGGQFVIIMKEKKTFSYVDIFSSARQHSILPTHILGTICDHVEKNFSVLLFRVTD